MVMTGKRVTHHNPNKSLHRPNSLFVLVPRVERVTLYVVDNTRILGNAIVVKHSL